MKVAIIGFDVEGRSSYSYFAGQGDHQITILDKNPKVTVPEGVESVLGEHYLDNLDRFDVLVRTAGLPPELILEKNPAVAAKITTNINEFLKASPTKNMIGITGTKGKGTTSTLLTKMLEADGKDVKLGGNIGLPPLDFLNDLSAESWVVLELSSFQLSDIKLSPHIAVCLMITPEHLDWHADSDQYYIAKTQLFSHQTSEDIAIYYAKNEVSKRIASVSPGWKIPYMDFPGARIAEGEILIDDKVVCKTNDVKLPGKHNLQNICAALTTFWKISQNLDAARSVVTSFAGLPHRIEFVAEKDGVKYFNDSYSTGLASTQAAIEAIKGPKIVIIGGYDRNMDIDHFADYINQTQAESQIQQLLLVGQTASKLQQAFEKSAFKNYKNCSELKNMADIVAEASKTARPGQSVILSPGFASFDMFKNFTDRGNQFKNEVNRL